jgi:hypothetical protein
VIGECKLEEYAQENTPNEPGDEDTLIDGELEEAQQYLKLVLKDDSKVAYYKC